MVVARRSAILQAELRKQVFVDGTVLRQRRGWAQLRKTAAIAETSAACAVTHEFLRL